MPDKPFKSKLTERVEKGEDFLESVLNNLPNEKTIKNILRIGTVGFVALILGVCQVLFGGIGLPGAGTLSLNRLAVFLLFVALVDGIFFIVSGVGLRYFKKWAPRLFFASTLIACVFPFGLMTLAVQSGLFTRGVENKEVNFLYILTIAFIIIVSTFLLVCRWLSNEKFKSIYLAASHRLYVKLYRNSNVLYERGILHLDREKIHTTVFGIFAVIGIGIVVWVITLISFSPMILAALFKKPAIYYSSFFLMLVAITGILEVFYLGAIGTADSKPWAQPMIKVISPMFFVLMVVSLIYVYWTSHISEKDFGPELSYFLIQLMPMALYMSIPLGTIFPLYIIHSLSIHIKKRRKG